MADSKKPTNQPVSRSKGRGSQGIKIVFFVLIIWASVIALGSFQTQASTDVRRPLIVIATMGVFLGVWATAIWVRQKR